MGYGYGPAFQGLRAAWRRGEELFAEVTLDTEQQEQAHRFGVHPALLDAALHTVFIVDQGSTEPQRLALPFSWSGVRIHRSGASSLRVRVTRAGLDGLSVTAFDGMGALVVSVDAVVGRPVDAIQLDGARGEGHDSLFRLEWVEVSAPSANGQARRFALLGDLAAAGVEDRYADLGALGEAIETGAPVPDVVLVAAPSGASSVEAAEAARAGTQQALGLLKGWLGEDRLADARLVVVTRGAVAARNGEVPDLVAASVLGLVRSAQSEHPGRFALVDLDRDGGGEIPWPELLLATDSRSSPCGQTRSMHRGLCGQGEVTR